jgi:cell division protein FtsA
MPQGYTVDSQKGVENPIGMEGTHLIANVQIIYGMMTAINNVVKCINRSGLGCPEVVLGIYAASEVVITKEEKDLGCVLIDIGGQTVNLAIFYDGYLRYIKQLPIGGDFITRDIARVERILPSEAKRIKETHGSAEAKMIIEDQVITALGMDNIANIKISERKLAEIIEARMREILTFAKDEIRNTEHAGLISSGAILIGGGAILNGAKDLAEQVFGMPVHIGVPHNVIGIDAVSESPLYGTAIGLIKFVEDKAEMPAKIKIGKGILAKLKAFIDQLF